MGTPRSPKGKTREVARRLALDFPEAVCELDHESPFQLLAATLRKIMRELIPDLAAVESAERAASRHPEYSV